MSGKACSQSSIVIKSLRYHFVSKAMANQQEEIREFAYTPQSAALTLRNAEGIPYLRPEVVQGADRLSRSGLDPESNLEVFIHQYSFTDLIGLTAQGHPLLERVDQNTLRATLFKQAQAYKSMFEVLLVFDSLGVDRLSRSDRQFTAEKAEATQRFQKQLLERASPPSPDIRNR